VLRIRKDARHGAVCRLRVSANPLPGGGGFLRLDVFSSAARSVTMVCQNPTRQFAADRLCRVIRTAADGVATSRSIPKPMLWGLHVAAGRRARLIGPPPARDSYLNVAAILDAAGRSGAQAVCIPLRRLSVGDPISLMPAARPAIVFNRPPAEAIRAMGSKGAAAKGCV